MYNVIPCPTNIWRAPCYGGFKREGYLELSKIMDELLIETHGIELGYHHCRTPSYGYFSKWWMPQNTMKGFNSEYFRACTILRNTYVPGKITIIKPCVLGYPHLRSVFLKMVDAPKLYSNLNPAYFRASSNYSHRPARHQQCHQDSMDARAITSLREGRDGAGKPRSAWGAIEGDHGLLLDGFKWYSIASNHVIVMHWCNIPTPKYRPLHIQKSSVPDSSAQSA